MCNCDYTKLHFVGGPCLLVAHLITQASLGGGYRISDTEYVETLDVSGNYNCNRTNRNRQHIRVGGGPDHQDPPPPPHTHTPGSAPRQAPGGWDL